MTHRLARLAQPLILGSLLCLASIEAAGGHEFWIDPDVYRVDSGAAIIGNTRTGQDFKGYRHLYLPKRFERFELHAPDGMRPVDGVVGDLPALNIETHSDGLHIVVYQSVQQTVDFEDWTVFQGYLEDEGLPPVKERHVARGLNPESFTEAFVRCAKSLIAVGDGAGEDRATGLPLELVALTNPYLGETPSVRLLWRGVPLPHRQIKVLYKQNAEGPGDRHTVTTGVGGVAQLPDLGPGLYLLNAVQLIENSDPPWLSYWASMTFEKP